MSTDKNIRLNKRLVELGLSDSRRKADDDIAGGKVYVNGELATLGMLLSAEDKVSLAGRTGSTRSDITIAFNKPVGYVSSHTAQNNDKTIFELLPKSFRTLKIAGRLDKDSKGLMILSSNGDLIQKLAHPSQGKTKEYMVELSTRLSPPDKNKLLSGVKIEDGISKFIRVSVINPSKIRVELGEGRNRQIRRTFNTLGYKVVSLERIRHGSTELGLLAPGEFVFLSDRDINR